MPTGPRVREALPDRAFFTSKGKICAHAIEKNSADVREAEIHAAGAGVGPAAGYNLVACVELHSFRPINVQVAKNIEGLITPLLKK